MDVSPLVGHAAPDVELRRPDGSAFPLSSLRGRPLVLVLGSYTCPQLRHGAPEVNRLYERHRDHARFLLAYIREAHPEGEAWQSTVNRREGISLPEARSVEERAEHAALCRRELKIPYEAALDGLDGKAEAAFSAFPSRVFVIDAARDGHLLERARRGELPARGARGRARGGPLRPPFGPRTRRGRPDA